MPLVLSLSPSVMDPSPIPINIPIESLPGLLSDARTVDRSGVAATACLAYDILISFDQEVEYIWKSSWSFPKFLYLFSRYFTLIVQLVDTSESTSFSVTNNSWTYFEAAAGQLVIMGVEISLMMRVYALYKRDKRILTLLLALYFSEILSSSLILGLGLKKIVSIAPLRGLLPPDFPLSGCFPLNVPGFFFSYWIPTLIFESVLFVLMVINFLRFTMIHKTRVPLLTLFVRDGTLFYAVIFVTLATLLTQVLLYELVNSALAQVAISWQLTVLSIAGSRLILNLRANSAKPVVEAAAFELTGMRFDSNAATDLTDPTYAYNTSSDQSTAFERSRLSDSSDMIRSQATGFPKVKSKAQAPSRTLLDRSDTNAVAASTDERRAPRRNNIGNSDWLSEWEGV
ncbi:hypothetical protein SCHPADRAFT_935121 [Schizopora paradoxa]|uniref:DUF6533 domain-containing protein n=1 Tax=Schizopora paradoxa TaxID=27342 RepID=A0A0H2S5T2_9AGAM|nr:hypothetical protein SCHPADRAFT_935121 [Schizopora paradoxa]